MRNGSVRFSLSKFTTEEEIDYVIEKVPPIIQNLRNNVAVLRPLRKTNKQQNKEARLN